MLVRIISAHARIRYRYPKLFRSRFFSGSLVACPTSLAGRNRSPAGQNFSNQIVRGVPVREALEKAELKSIIKPSERAVEIKCADYAITSPLFCEQFDWKSCPEFGPEPVQFRLTDAVAVIGFGWRNARAPPTPCRRRASCGPLISRSRTLGRV